MKQNNAAEYIKYIYWMSAKEESRLREEPEARKIKIADAKGVVCTSLIANQKITSVAPKVWNQSCARQGSWYRASDKKDLYLVVSSFELEHHHDKLTATITKSEFVPPRWASIEEKKALVRDLSIQKQAPIEWQRVKEKEKKIYLKWAKRLGSEVEDYDFLYLTHTANHANFINPRLYVQFGNGIIPFSIDCSAHLCSCCLELFQILGNNHHQKLVAPCPGANVYGRLKANQYLLVQRR
jgi:hypothetical protein